MEKVKARKQLNALQTDILFVLYKFRFATRELIVKYQGLKSKTYTHYRLTGLVEQEYIGRHLSPEDRINRRPATYFILPKGIKVLKQQESLNPKSLTAMDNDRRAGGQFIDNCLSIFNIYIKLNELYGKSLNFYAKSEAAEYESFPRPLPDAFAQINSKNFFLELITENIPGFAVKRRLLRYIEHCDEGDWEELGETYPYVLLVCESSSIEKRAQKLASRALYSSEADELLIYTTTLKALLACQAREETIWSDVEDSDELIALTQTVNKPILKP